MAETSGFFQAMADEATGQPDRRYLAKQFCDYFALFIGNGVFGSPTNQLIVAPGQSGLSVVVKPGNAFIDGMWYNNSSDKQIFIVPNYESQVRVDTVRVRMSQVTRAITVEVFTGDSELQRGEDIYDLQLATISVQPFAETISAANIKDTRPDQSVCGFVTSLMSVQTTADLFAQYQAQFDEWFADVQGALSGDVAGNLLVRMENLETKVDSDLEDLRNDMSELSSSVDDKISDAIGSESSNERIVIGTNTSSSWTGDGSQFVFATLPQGFQMPTKAGQHVFIEILYGVDGAYFNSHVVTTGSIKLIDNNQKLLLGGFIPGYGYFAREATWSGSLVGGATLRIGPIKQYKTDSWTESSSTRNNAIVPRYAFLSVNNKIVNSSGSPWS